MGSHPTRSNSYLGGNCCTVSFPQEFSRASISSFPGTGIRESSSTFRISSFHVVITLTKKQKQRHQQPNPCHQKTKTSCHALPRLPQITTKTSWCLYTKRGSGERKALMLNKKQFRAAKTITDMHSPHENQEEPRPWRTTYWCCSA